MMSISEDDLKKELVDITTEMYRSGVVTSAGGNLSVRCATRNDAAWITPSQIFKGELLPEQMVMIDMHGKKIEGDFKPSVESHYHASIMKHRSEINAVVHSHAPMATALAICEMDILPITTEAILISEMPIIPWILGGTKELAHAVQEQVAKTKVPGAFLRNHGLITVGATLRKAADATLIIEHTIKILLACKIVGAQPSLIPEDAIKNLSQFIGAI
ncbi:MAG: class II aldolase/adducin family protein [Anaerolineales bacterium]|jgi:autoinducer 2 (AI-2) kinase